MAFNEFVNICSGDIGLKKRVWIEQQRAVTNSTVLEAYNSSRIIDAVEGALRIGREDIVNSLRMCYDGCPFCIGVPYCTSGKNEQYAHISLETARKFVEKLCVTTGDTGEVSKLIRSGGRVVENVGENYTILLL
jgi:hypothetical protein